jgi:hypothetical protein
MSPTNTGNKIKFNDLDTCNEEQKKAILALASKGIINGISEDLFMPNKCITRGEMSVLIAKVLKIYDDNSESDFVDVKKSDFFYRHLSSAVNKKVFNGYPDNTFRPNNFVSKQEVIAIGARGLKYYGYNYGSEEEKKIILASLKGYIPDWVKEHIAILASNNVLLWEESSEFNGEKPYVRGNVAIIIYGILNLLENDNYTIMN